MTALVMPRHEAWRAAYRANRYMIDASDQNVAQRCRDITVNMMGVDASGRITPGSPTPSRVQWWERWTHILEEFALRGIGFRSDLELIGRDAMPWVSAPEPPRGLKILRGSRLPSTPYLARIGRKEHLREAYTRGRIRIAPAASYADAPLNSAIRDDELTVTATASGRHMNLRRYDPRTGKEGEPIQVSGEMQWSTRLTQNFYVLCLTHSYDLRLLDDFRGDALLLITDPGRFVKRLTRAVAKARPDLQSAIGAVQYYDPYFVDPSGGWVPMLKHFRHAYQNEIRFVWTGPNLDLAAEAFFVDLGPLRDVARLFLLPD
jgi:hypothetical protein